MVMREGIGRGSSLSLVKTSCSLPGSVRILVGFFKLLLCRAEVACPSPYSACVLSWCVERTTQFQGCFTPHCEIIEST